MVRPAKIFQLHLFKFPGAEGKIARIYFVSESFPHLRNSKWELLSRHLQNIFELNKNCLRGLRAEIGDGRLIFRRPDIGLKHEIKGARFSQIFAPTNHALFPRSSPVTGPLGTGIYSYGSPPLGR